MKSLDKAAINILIFWAATKLVKKIFDIPEKPFIQINIGDKKKEENIKEERCDYDADEEVILTVEGQ